MLKNYPIAAFCTYDIFHYVKLTKKNGRNYVTYTEDINSATIWESIEEYEKSRKKSKVLQKYTRSIALTKDDFPEFFHQYIYPNYVTEKI